MPTQLSEAVRRLGGALARRHAAGLVDAELWERYVRNRDGTAFEALVRRHGPMVLGVCRRILRNEPDAEDAFQITFLVFVRRAASLRSPDAIANWLHGVATRTSLEVRNAVARRRVKEATVPPRETIPEGPPAELRHVLDEELGRLAERYRVAVVLCDLEGKTRREVAEQLGWAEGTVASRLARGRSILARRLAHRGFAAALVAAALAGGAASAGVSARLIASTVRTATDGASANVAFSGQGIPLTEGVGRSMFLTKLVTAATLVFGVTALEVVSTTGATEPAAQEKARANPDDVRERVAEAKQQLQQLQQKLAKLEQEVPAGRDGAAGALAERFKHRVAFEIGDTETRDGGRIEIREVWGTRPKIEIGGQYLVRGKYKLPAGQKGKLYFYLTASTSAGAATGTLDLQMQNLDKQEGEFTLVHGMENPGHFHLILTDPDKYSQWFANVYFGTGDTVWRKKP
ncbi:sigma-70 family rna polymerase sigma factor : RNA polymerase sigma factor, sigma-70 family OS=Singulisphaera acidiphila (strain ATCC BAA-1392 / DSM 18658 / VKM B-2454 / MOB10) GN=Sinac_6419 PE=4 SV=1: Sigma70_r2: Sigma70_r4_2 [Gemmata massiliana]|uniref:ECF RNA polymerase sigma factor SigE n=1 Tax=Gemmata massiliana TaxID=1210884 RepID=A0A6P2D724_9BACT|nr:sigma-70 family RNA polymerase sigma factor [Gemmata massiliana]VTR96266.1 sigma-70 family rna polymerase sigma factor : RNA polymerase sigma factor, sigma-70 family OS=Singulisphaera acidiphila (strain ATCC BAA-1392 / DSM 18658 / VKM B-2454 / MOB10) GN=Sinac_6419 PE=4 SV=1: Sigma70_r2: Sigma70_r4_2 [Gemmata massiliana]